jgi:AcrR family transcriptional regulator
MNKKLKLLMQQGVDGTTLADVLELVDGVPKELPY